MREVASYCRSSRKSTLVVHTMSKRIEQNARCTSPGRASFIRRASATRSTILGRPYSCAYADTASERSRVRVVLEFRSQFASKSSHKGTWRPGGTTAFRDIPAPITGSQRPATRSSRRGFRKVPLGIGSSALLVQLTFYPTAVSLHVASFASTGCRVRRGAKSASHPSPQQFRVLPAVDPVDHEMPTRSDRRSSLPLLIQKGSRPSGVHGHVHQAVPSIAVL